MKPPLSQKRVKKKFDRQNFFESVYEVVKEIPKGRVTNYGAIAEYLGTGLSARTVGWALKSSITGASKIPAHRVVNRNGLLTGKHHFATPTLMQELLEAEEVEVEDDKVKDFEKHFWNPDKELKVQKLKSNKSKRK